MDIMILEEDSYLTMGLILAVFLFIVILCICLLPKIGPYEPGQNRWKKYIKSIDPTSEKDIFDKILTLSDEDFKSYLLSIKKKINYKYRTNKKGLKNTILKRSMLNVINKHLTELPFERIKQIEEIFPLSRRVYFGPGLNKEVYDKKNFKKKFHFKIKPDHTVPQLESIIDLAHYFNIRVNNLLGYSFNQKRTKTSHYIKRNKIFEKFGDIKIPDD